MFVKFLAAPWSVALVFLPHHLKYQRPHCSGLGCQVFTVLHRSRSEAGESKHRFLSIGHELQASWMKPSLAFVMIRLPTMLTTSKNGMSSAPNSFQEHDQVCRADCLFCTVDTGENRIEEILCHCPRVCFSKHQLVKL